ncbi:HNH endonuclease [Bacillus haynesii]|uniref:HNH endonuclease n=1 Tax=Bacillus haynesii TaxID=1925021 RepID=UPI00227FC11C|nr:HNH endonuclease [Bacillus haynesii]MCY9274574.1 HNH endonuclease [Bacillus haynesii]
MGCEVTMIFDDGYSPKHKFVRVRDIEYKVTESGCWECSSHRRDEAGYTVIRRGGKSPQRLHRYVYQLINGPLESHQVVMHVCDNPSCFNPGHLRVGSHADNVKDKVQKDRHCKGETNGSSKLTEEEVAAIRKDTRSHIAISKDYNVNRATIGQIKRGETWTHVS